MQDSVVDTELKQTAASYSNKKRQEPLLQTPERKKRHRPLLQAFKQKRKRKKKNTAAELSPYWRSSISPYQRHYREKYCVEVEEQKREKEKIEEMEKREEGEKSSIFP